MAQINISKYHYAVNFELSFTTISQNTANNTSQVRVLGRLTGTGNGEWGTATTGTVTFNGTSHNFNVPAYSFSNGSSVYMELFKETFTVAHGSDGKKTVSGSMVWNHGSTAFKTASVSETVALATIPRYTTVTNPSISSITRNSYKFSFSTGHTISEWQYSSNGGAWTAGQTGDRTSGTKTLSGFGANTKPTIKVRVKRKDSGLWTESGVVTVTLEATASPNTPTFSSITRNSFVINVSANKSFNGFQYSLDDGTSWSAKQSGSSASITGRPANTLHNVRVRVYDGIHTGTLSGASARGQVRTLAIASPNTPTLSSKTAIQVVFNWSSNRTVTNVQYKRWSSDAWQSAGADFSARTSGSVTITGLSPNTTYPISVRVKDAVHGTWSGGSGNLSVTTYALSTVKGTNFNLGSTVTATVTEAHTSMYHDIVLEANYGGSWKQVASVTNQNKDASLTIPAATITAIENGTPNSKTVSMRLKVTTKWGSGGVVQGSAQTSPTFTATIINANPTLSGITYKDNHSNATFVNWKGGDQKILRNVSPVRAILGTATARKGAKLSHYVFNINGKSFTVNANGTATQTGAIRDLGVIDSATNLNIDVTVYDSRNNSTPMSVPVSMLDYMPPQVLTIEAQRLNNYEPNTTLVVSGRSYIVKPTTASDNVNTYTAKYRMKEVGTSTWSSYTNVTVTKSYESGNWQNYSVNHYMGTFDSDKSYDIQFVFQDSVGTQYTQNTVLTKGIGLMTFLEDKVELGVPLYDKESEKKYLLEGEGGLDTVSWSDVTDKPSTFAPATHTHAWSEVSGKPSTFAPSSHNHAGTTTTGTQTTHTTAYGTIQLGPMNSSANHIYATLDKPFYLNKDLQVANGKQVWHSGNVPTTATRWPTWAEVTGKPSTFSPSSHTHETRNHSANGYVKLGIGTIIQWGSISYPANTNSVTLTYPIAFPSACTSLVVTANHGTSVQSWVSINTTISNRTRTNAVVRQRSSDDNVPSIHARTADWIAIGY